MTSKSLKNQVNFVLKHSLISKYIYYINIVQILKENIASNKCTFFHNCDGVNMITFFSRHYFNTKALTANEQDQSQCEY